MTLTSQNAGPSAPHYTITLSELQIRRNLNCDFYSPLIWFSGAHARTQKPPGRYAGIQGGIVQSCMMIIALDLTIISCFPPYVATLNVEMKNNQSKRHWHGTASTDQRLPPNPRLWDPLISPERRGANFWKVQVVRFANFCFDMK